VSNQTVTEIHPGASIDRTVARVVRSLLAANGLQAKDMARAIGMHEGRLSERLNGKAKITATDIARWADFFGVDPGQLFKDPATRPDVGLPQSLYVGGDNVIKLFPDVEPCDMQLASGQ
jgi:transcriptional regulator with XRE-family HTH domain